MKYLDHTHPYKQKKPEFKHTPFLNKECPLGRPEISVKTFLLILGLIRGSQTGAEELSLYWGTWPISSPLSTQWGVPAEQEMRTTAEWEEEAQNMPS